MFRGTIQGVPVFLVRPADGVQSNIFKGQKIYCGNYDDTEAYLYFSR